MYTITLFLPLVDVKPTPLTTRLLVSFRLVYYRLAKSNPPNHNNGDGGLSLSKTNQWQNFHESVKSLLSDGRQGKWALITLSSKKKQRVVLNDRRMAFDVAPFAVDNNDATSSRDMSIFTAKLLPRALSLSL